MNAVIETQASIEAALEDQATRENSPSGARISAPSSVPARLPLRQARQRWNSSLSNLDLQCLLQIIEVDLVPQLLNSYSPARYAPDDRLTSG